MATANRTCGTPPLPESEKVKIREETKNHPIFKMRPSDWKERNPKIGKELDDQEDSIRKDPKMKEGKKWAKPDGTPVSVNGTVSSADTNGNRTLVRRMTYDDNVYYTTIPVICHCITVNGFYNHIPQERFENQIARLNAFYKDQKKLVAFTLVAVKYYTKPEWQVITNSRQEGSKAFNMRAQTRIGGTWTLNIWTTELDAQDPTKYLEGFAR